MKKFLAATTAVAVLGAGAYVGIGANAADHLDSPSVEADGRTDINDLFAFAAPDGSDNTVLIMTVNPVAGVASPTTFDPGAEYEFRLRDGAAIDERGKITVTFGEPDDSGQQSVNIDDGFNGRQTFADSGRTGEEIDLSNGGKVTAGVFDDPFFFDLVAFQNGLAFCEGGVGNDFFAGLNVSAIVVEVPNSVIGSNGEGVAVWARSRVANGDQIDRMGRPAINTVLIPSANKDRFNDVKASQDTRLFRDDVIATLEALGNSNEAASGLADVLLPDVLTFTVGSPDGFLNGRQLSNDVIDAELGLISGGALTTDCVDSNDREFSQSFPYLASANR